MKLTRGLAGAAMLTLVAQFAAYGTAILPLGADIAAASSQDTTYARQISEGEVTLELAPKWQDSVLVVEVAANTHSVDLSGMNLGEQTRLIVDDTEVAPAEAGSLSGHHGSATLVFRLAERPSSFAIEIRDVPDVPLRRLTWPEGEATP